MHGKNALRLSLVGAWVAVAVAVGIAKQPAFAQEATYSEDFEDGEAQGWNLEPGWAVIDDGGNRVLAGEGHLNAILQDVDAADNVRISLRLRLLKGDFHLPFRVSESGRYFVTLSSDGSFLSQAISSGEVQGNIVGQRRAFSLGDWHQLEVLLHGGRIEFRVDGERAWIYSDPAPLTAGMLGLESLLDSPVQVDDIQVFTGEPVPATDTPSPTRPAPTLQGTYQEDFEDGLAQGWELEPGWTMTFDEGSQVLAGESGGTRVSMGGSGVDVGEEVRVSLRMRLLQGTFHLRLRIGASGQYFVSINNSFSSMNKQPAEGRFEEHIVRGARYTSPERWQKLEVLLQGGRIEFLVDGRRQWVYTDPEPLPAGKMGFGLVPGSEVLIDDIVVTGATRVDATPTFGLEGLAATLGAASQLAPIEPTATPAVAQVVESTPEAGEGGFPFNLPCLGALFVPLAIVGALGLSRPRGPE